MWFKGLGYAAVSNYSVAKDIQLFRGYKYNHLEFGYKLEFNGKRLQSEAIFSRLRVTYSEFKVKAFYLRLESELYITVRDYRCKNKNRDNVVNTRI